jgi:hypothetical protein
MRQALATLALALGPWAAPSGAADPFDAARFREHAAALAADELEGRDVGTPGAARAADYIAAQFRADGLEPLGDGGTSFQDFKFNDLRARNVLAILPGAGPLADQCVIVSAHYDHIGKRPDARGGEDAIFNGADDNASGVAAMLLIAEGLARDRESLPASRRAVVFAAFDAEERYLQGSRYYVEHPARPLDKTVAVLNLDMVGRLRRDELFAGDAATCDFLVQNLAKLARESGLRIETRGGGAARSDQAVFIERRIPGVQFQTGVHSDYHQVTDEVATLNCDGGARVARVVYRLLRAAIEHPGPLAFRPLDPTYDIQHLLGIVARLGIIPEVNTQPGRYPKVRFVVPGSPAARAGVKGGDQITGFNGGTFARVEDALTAFAELDFTRDLKLSLLRDGKAAEATVPAEVFASLAGPALKPLGDGRFEATFRFKAPAGTKAVYLAGTFNGWKPNELKMDGPDKAGAFTRRLELKPGLYEYKFVVEGRTWTPDPDNMHQLGPDRNSAVWVGIKPHQAPTAEAPGR